MYTKEELDFISNVMGYRFDPETASDDEWVGMEDKIGTKLVLECLDENYEPNDIGVMCENILAKLP